MTRRVLSNGNGVSALTDDTNSLGVGVSALTDDTNSLGVGVSALTDNTNSLGVGVSALTDDTNSLGVGVSALTDDTNSLRYMTCNDISTLNEYTWSDVRQHVTTDSKWLVIDGLVYDITTWQRKHPGGARIINHFVGQDATDVWVAMHKNKKYAIKFLKPILVGRLVDDTTCTTKAASDVLTSEFRALRRSVEASGLLDPDPTFYSAHIAHILCIELAAYWVLSQYGVTWSTYLLAAILLSTAQAQSGWSQHDYGHLSVFPTSRLNHLMHYFIIGHLKGASSHWWNFRHHQHHAKPNIIGKDPDIGIAYLFLLGDRLPVQWGLRKKGFMPYNWQHGYFWLLGPPILLPIYFHLENLYFVFKRRDWIDLFWTVTFFTRYFYCYAPILGGWSAFGLYMFVRFLESHWFTLVTQMNHIPMQVDRDLDTDWVTTQLAASCNVKSSFFNDWFTGHLNFQIEHHLFPTMPRHNYHKVAPQVRQLCEKYSIKYIEKPLLTAFADIYRSLRKSGRLWYEAYYSI